MHPPYGRCSDAQPPGPLMPVAPVRRHLICRITHFWLPLGCHRSLDLGWMAAVRFYARLSDHAVIKMAWRADGRDHRPSTVYSGSLRVVITIHAQAAMRRYANMHLAQLPDTGIGVSPHFHTTARARDYHQFLGHGGQH